MLDPDSNQVSLEQFYAADAMVLGRKTFEGLAAVWPTLVDAPGLAGVRARLGYALTRQAARGRGFSHPFSEAYPCYAGSTWFTASRRGCAHLLERAGDAALTAAFARMHMGDEMYFPSIFRNSG